MGGSFSGTTKIVYRTRDKIPVEYIYFDLKGGNRFPDCTLTEAQVNQQFEECLSNIDAPADQIALLSQLTSKYRFRFVVLHARKVQEYRERYELRKLRKTEKFEEGVFRGFEDYRRKQLQNQLNELESSPSNSKVLLVNLDNYIVQKNAHHEFIEVDGLSRVVALLNKLASANRRGTGTVFQGQVDILKFMRSFSDRTGREYYDAVRKIEDYALVLLRVYHPVQVAVSALVLVLLQDYCWKAQGSVSLVQSLQAYRMEQGNKGALDPFAQTIYSTNNIFMCYYNLRFINELLVSTVQEAEQQRLEEHLRVVRYELLIEDIKGKLEQGFFKIDACTFQTVSQQVYRTAALAAPPPDLAHAPLNRTTLTLDSLQHHLLQDCAQEQPDESSEEGEGVVAFVGEGDQKGFNRFVLDTFTEIQHFHKYQILKGEEGGEGEWLAGEVERVRECGAGVEEYMRRMQASCLKLGVQEIMLSCLRTLQYFEKSEWLKLDHFLQQEIKLMRIGVDAITLHNRLLEAEQTIAQLRKLQLNSPANLSTSTTLSLEDGSNKSGVQMPTLPPIPNGLPPPPPPPPNGLPPPPPLPLNGLPPPPPLNGLPPPPPLNGLPPPPPLNGLPPPPPLNGLPQPPPLNGLPPLPPNGLQLPVTGFIAEKTKQKRKPGVAMKGCNLAVVNYQKIVDSIWQKVDDLKVKLNEKELMTLFCKEKVGEKPQKKDQPEKKVEKVKKQAVTLMEAGRCRNLQIVLAKLKMPEGAFAEALTRCSGDFVSRSVLDIIVQKLPTPEEEALISSYTGDPKVLGRSQLFIKQLISIPDYLNRIKALQLYHYGEEAVVELKRKADDLRKIFSWLKGNSRLHHVLELGLAVGNFLNGEGPKGGAWGFRVESLQRLEEVKATDGRMNLAFYIVKQAWKRFPYPIFQREEVDRLQIISKLPVAQLKTQLTELKQAILSTEKAAKSVSTKLSNDQIAVFCKQVLSKIVPKMSELEESCTQAEKAFKECACFYCEDPTKGGSDDIGRRLYKGVLFLFHTEKTYCELQDRRLKEQAKKQHQAITRQSKALDSKPPNEERIKVLQKVEKAREKRVLQYLVQRRNSKMVAVRMSRLSKGMPNQKVQDSLPFAKQK